MTTRKTDKPLRLQLMGPIALIDAEGTDLTPRSRKGQALLAMLCTGRNGRRTRAWLQANLWSDRAPAQASGSLRSCLHELRNRLGPHSATLYADRTIVEFDLDQVHVDILDMSQLRWLGTVTAGAVFLEGLEVVDPQFCIWLEEQRQHWARRGQAAHQADTEQSLATGFVPPAGLAWPAAHQSVADTERPADAPDWSLSLSVFPLENRTGDPGHDFVGYGLAEDLINRLQRLKWLPIIGAGRSFLDRAPQLAGGTAVADRLGARFFVDGSLTADRNKPVVRLRLCDAETTRVLWSETFDLQPFLTGEAADAAFDHVVGAIDRSVSRSMLRKVMASPDQPHGFLDQIWRGRWHLARLTREDSEAARRHLEAALKLQPNAPEALIQMAFWHLWRTWVSREGELGLSAGEHFARRAQELDPDDGRCYALLGIAEAWRRNHSNAILLLQDAVELNPNLAIAHHQLGSALNHADRPDEAVEPIAQAMRYSPRDNLDFAFQTEMAVALARMCHFEEAFVRASRALLSKPRYWYGHLVRILAAEGMGDPDRIRQARAALERSGAQITEAQLSWLPFDSDDFPAQLRALL